MGHLRHVQFITGTQLDRGLRTAQPLHAGQEKYNSLTAAFLRNAVGAVIAYDITNKSSFEDVDNARIGWLKQFQVRNTTLYGR
jgi:hypothetical protein